MDEAPKIEIYFFLFSLLYNAPKTIVYRKWKYWKSIFQNQFSWLRSFSSDYILVNVKSLLSIWSNPMKNWNSREKKSFRLVYGIKTKSFRQDETFTKYCHCSLRFPTHFSHVLETSWKRGKIYFFLFSKACFSVWM